MHSLEQPLDNALIEDIVTRTVDELTPHGLFNFNAPRQTLMGEGAILRIGEMLGKLDVTHVLVVADRVVHDKGLMKSMERSLERAGIEFTIYPAITQEPDETVVASATELLTRNKADFILGFGGGSALDAAKAIALTGSSECSLHQLAEPGFSGRRSVGLGAVPTTAGTGSEVTDISVIMRAGRRHKFVIKNGDLMPDLAIVDPGLMLNLPPRVTAATGIDALTHAIEAYAARNSHPLAKALAICAIQSIAEALPVVVGNGGDRAARLTMSTASYKAGLAFSNSGLGLVHAISHQIGPRFNLAHGIANGILLPYVMKFNALVCQREYAAIAHMLGVSHAGMTEREQCMASIDAVRQLLSDIGLPEDLAGTSIRRDDFSAIAVEALTDVCIESNPRDVTEADIVKLLEEACGTKKNL
ncbi:iron-containing alcohol dehydrogenase [Marinobacter sp. F3R11]|uniref:iron-containing alcohol dehydrogenase n=1 Tax=Marinobacter sp. F3R11 TaxID=2267231 RepID=UPI000DE88FC9|nr:iron-containing alcohol dehydrogenase [Marinobacter sp. F3R11]RBW49777.1 NAD-dependent alcohol dehydrogenase [Marinobacter sp. F3R11]